MGDLFKNSYEFQKQQLINVADETTLNANFSSISTALTNLNNTTINNSVIDSENQRLATKNERIQAMSSSQSRMNALNESYRKKNWEYIKILIVIAISLLTILGISTFLRNTIPDIFIDLLTAIIAGLAIIYSIMVYKQISARSAIDFDKLNLGNPATNSEKDDKATKKIISAGESGDLLGATNECSGASCCEEGTKWCASKNRCFPDDTTFESKCAEGFGGMMGSMNSKKSNKIDYAETEFSDYAPYK